METNKKDSYTMNKKKKDAWFSAFYHKQTARIGRSLKGRKMCSRG
jgi:hypothetical protein